jgi:hypothetical protein
VDGRGDGVEPDSGLFDKAIHEVPIAVHRDLDRGVAIRVWMVLGCSPSAVRQILTKVPHRKNPLASVAQAVVSGGG